MTVRWLILSRGEDREHGTHTEFVLTHLQQQKQVLTTFLSIYINNPNRDEELKLDVHTAQSTLVITLHGAEELFSSCMISRSRKSWVGIIMVRVRSSPVSVSCGRADTGEEDERMRRSDVSQKMSCLWGCDTEIGRLCSSLCS